MKTIRQQYLIKAPLDEVWKSLVDPKYINTWGGGPSVMREKENSEFSLWGGTIWGTNKKVIKNKFLKQEWFSDEDVKWDKPSVVSFYLSFAKGVTTVDLLHEDIPDQNADNIKEGWNDYYLGPLKDYLESN